MYDTEFNTIYLIKFKQILISYFSSFFAPFQLLVLGETLSPLFQSFILSSRQLEVQLFLFFIPQFILALAMVIFIECFLFSFFWRGQVQ